MKKVAGERKLGELGRRVSGKRWEGFEKYGFALRRTLRTSRNRYAGRQRVWWHLRAEGGSQKAKRSRFGFAKAASQDSNGFIVSVACYNLNMDRLGENIGSG